MDQNEVWVGLVGMRPRNENTFLGISEGGYTTIFALTNGYKGYIKQVEQFLKENDIELYSARDKK